MKYLKILVSLLFLSTFTIHAFGQVTPQQIATKVCGELKKIDHSGDMLTMQAQAATIIKDILPAMDHGKILADYKSNNKSAIKELTDDQVSELVIEDIVYYLMKDCREFLSMVIYANQPVPEVSATGLTLGDKFTVLLEQRLKSTPMSQALVNECKNAIIEQNMATIQKAYGSNYLTAFDHEFKAYLYTKCEPFMRWTLRDSIKQFKKLQNLRNVIPGLF